MSSPGRSLAFEENALDFGERGIGKVFRHFANQPLYELIVIHPPELPQRPWGRDYDQRPKTILQRHTVQCFGGLGSETILSDLARIGLVVGAPPGADAREGAARAIAPKFAVGAALLLVLLYELQMRELDVTPIAQE